MPKKTLMMVFVCNPYLAILQKRTYLKYWKDDVDEVLIGINGKNDKVIDFIKNLWTDDKVKAIEIVREERRQGLMFDLLYPHATGDILITMDSDNFIYKKGFIERTCQIFNQGYTSIGSTGNHAFPYQVAKPFVSKYGCVRFNPFIAFFKKEIIDQMKVVKFGTCNFEQGDKLDFWGEPMPCKGWIDVLGQFCLRYFMISNKKYTIAQQGDGYMHIGGLSSLWRRFWCSLDMTNENKFTARTRDTKAQGHNYWRFYQAIYEATKDQYPDKSFNEEYEKGFLEQVTHSKTDLNSMKQGAEQIRREFKDIFV